MQIILSTNSVQMVRLFVFNTFQNETNATHKKFDFFFHGKLDEEHRKSANNARESEKANAGDEVKNEAKCFV